MHPSTYARTDPDRLAVVMVSSGCTRTYRELDEASARLASQWAATGLGVGDHVAIVAENCVGYMDGVWAALRSGMYLTPVNWHLTSQEIEHVLHDSGTRSVVTTPALEPLVREAVRNLGRSPAIVVIDGDEGPGCGRAATTMNSDPAVPRPEREPRGELMLYSSGTTGTPKGIKPRLTGRTLDERHGAITMLNQKYFAFGEDTVYLSPAPMYHSAPLQYSISVHALGGTLVCMEHFDPVEFLDAVDRHQVTHTQLVPTMFVRLLKLTASERARATLRSLRYAIHSAAPCPVDVKRSIIEWWGPIVWEYYGGSEGNGMTLVSPQEWMARPGTVGRAVAGDLHICGDEGRELGPGDVGSVYFELPRTAFEYHGDPAKTRASRHPDHPNWSTLGDIGMIDGDGYLFLSDRKAFMIISGGVNIYPQEVENCMIMHESVADVAVFGLPDPEMGEYVHAVVQLVDGLVGDDALARKLIEFTCSRIARFKCPRAIDFHAELPRQPNGKLYKAQLRSEYLARTEKAQ